MDTFWWFIFNLCLYVVFYFGFKKKFIDSLLLTSCTAFIIIFIIRLL